MMRRPGRDETLIAAAVCADRGYTRARTPSTPTTSSTMPTTRVNQAAAFVAGKLQ
jgi:hypothetical protein